MKISKLITTFVSSILLAACAQIDPMISGESEIGKKDHAALAEYYENSAAQAKQKLVEQEHALKTYETKPHVYMYGKRKKEFQSNATANIREYKKQIKKNLELACFYRKLAAKQTTNGTAIIENETHWELDNKHGM